VDSRREHFLIGVETGEAVVVLGGEFFRAQGFLELGFGGVEVVREDVAHGGQADVGVGEDAVLGGAGSASAAADQADLDLLGGAGGVGDGGAEAGHGYG